MREQVNHLLAVDVANESGTPGIPGVLFARYTQQAAGQMGKLACTGGRVYAPLRSALDVCHWHTAPFAGQRTANGFAVSCPKYRDG